MQLFAQHVAMLYHNHSFMANDINIQKLKCEYPEFFRQFTPEFLEFIFSEKTSSNIANICLKNGIEDKEKIEKIAYRITLALFDQVPKENLTEIFEKGVKLDRETAKKISLEINRSIFSQAPKIQQKKIQTQPPKPFTSIMEVLMKEEEPKKSAKKDIYQEPIE